MKLRVIGTGSSGNAYLLRAGGASLLLDAGLPLQKIITACPEWNTIAGCLITHEHADHGMSANQIAAMGIPTYATAGTVDKLLNGSLTRLNAVRSLSSFDVGEFTVLPFPVEHDASEPCGWLIRSNTTGETAIYATDTYYLRYTFPGVHMWIVECNYVEDILKKSDLDDKFYLRLIKSHMSLRRLCEALEANDLTEARAIVLVHLSDERSDEARMIEAVTNAAGISEVYAARAGETYEMHLTPF